MNREPIWGGVSFFGTGHRPFCVFGDLAEQAKSREHVTWVKGQSGNPKGSAKKAQSMTELLRHELLRKVDGQSQRTLLMRRLLTIALTGADKDAITAIKYVVDRVDGTPITMQPDGTGEAFEITIKRTGTPNAETGARSSTEAG